MAEDPRVAGREVVPGDEPSDGDASERPATAVAAAEGEQTDERDGAEPEATVTGSRESEDAATTATAVTDDDRDVDVPEAASADATGPGPWVLDPPASVADEPAVADMGMAAGGGATLEPLPRLDTIPAPFGVAPVVEPVVRPVRWRRLRRLLSVLASIIVGVPTVIVVVGLAVALLLNPIWVASEQDRAESGLETGYGPVELRLATDSILSDLVFGPPNFAVMIGGQPVLAERERSHLRDVRNVFIEFAAVALVSLLILVLARILSRRNPIAFWSRVRRASQVLAYAVVFVGLVAVIAFAPLFELFHGLLFPAGSFDFDPTSDRLVQLFPERFWSDTALALAVAIFAISLLSVWWAGRRIRNLSEPR